MFVKQSSSMSEKRDAFEEAYDELDAKDTQNEATKVVEDLTSPPPAAANTDVKVGVNEALGEDISEELQKLREQQTEALKAKQEQILKQKELEMALVRTAAIKPSAKVMALQEEAAKAEVEAKLLQEEAEQVRLQAKASARLHMKNYVRREVLGNDETETRQDRSQKRGWSIASWSHSLLDSACAQLESMRDENNEIRVECVDDFAEETKSWLNTVLEVEYCGDKSSSNDSFVEFSGML